MPLMLYNTLSKRKEQFTPQDPARVTMYVCGPTVYNRAHIGNARPPVVFDVLRRLLKLKYGQVVYARNITDIDDKINAEARKRGVDIGEVAGQYAKAYHEDMGALGVGLPDIEPYATDHIPQMIAMMEKLIAEGHAYEAEGHVLFSVASFDDYGKFSGRDRDEMIAGARVEVAPYKKDPADFVLWKPSTADQPGWDSPWGRGRPGWHLECSAMIEKHLGETIDIHGGGIDLVFPHHENEIAQSRCAHHGAPLARYWLHNGFLSLDKEKMSKSLGNVLLPHDLLGRGVKGEAIRYALLSAQYRQPLDWSDDLLDQAKSALDRYYRLLNDHKDVPVDEAAHVPAGFLAALEDDLNTPKAFAELSGLAKDLTHASTDAEKRAAKSAFMKAAGLLGLLESDPEAWFQAERAGAISAEEIEALIEARKQARAAKDFAKADQIRDQLKAQGVLIEDKPEGAIWRRA